MPDIITTSENLKVETLYVDGDTRTITLKNPKDAISDDQITELNAFIQANNLLIGDKTGATFGRISKVTKVSQSRTDIDLNL